MLTHNSNAANEFMSFKACDASIKLLSARVASWPAGRWTSSAAAWCSGSTCSVWRDENRKVLSNKPLTASLNDPLTKTPPRHVTAVTTSTTLTKRWLTRALTYFCHHLPNRGRRERISKEEQKTKRIYIYIFYFFLVWEHNLLLGGLYFGLFFRT